MDRTKSQTWEMFEKNKRGKCLFIFGTGGGLAHFFRNYCNHMEITGFIDNNTVRHNQAVGWYCAEAWQTEYEDMVIQSPSVLSGYRSRDVIVLITVMNGYDAIVAQLGQMGISDCYVLPVLEANESQSSVCREAEDMKKVKEAYRDWCCRQEIMKNKIVMYIGSYGGHARQITKQLLKQRQNLDLVWLVDDPNEDAPETVRLIYTNNWKRYIYEVETAKVWVFDTPTPALLFKREEQIYIQVKHWSSITLKKFGLEDKNCCTSPEIEASLKYDGRKIDYLFSGSEFDEMSFKSGFAFKGQPIRVGSARSDILFDPSVRPKVLQWFHLDEKAQILLYAPTFRYKDYHAHRGMDVSLDLEGVRRKLTDKFGGEWFVLVRFHPLVDFASSGLAENSYIFNAGAYPDSEELVNAANVVITDYSSIMFEGAFIKKPLFLYAPDYQEFIVEDRDFLIDYDTLPFPRAESNEELFQCIMHFDKVQYKEKLTAFLDKYGIREDGHASERAAKFISDLLFNT